MFIRRRRLLWLILVIGSSWVVISTYFVRSNDDSQSRLHDSRTRNKNSVGSDAVASAGLIPSNDFYYRDEYDSAEKVISVDKEEVTSRHGLKVFTSVPAAYDVADREIDLKDKYDQDNFAQQDESWQPASKSPVLHRGKEPTPKVQESSALEFAQQPKKMFTPHVGQVKLPPGNDIVFLFHYVAIVFVCLTAHDRLGRFSVSADVFKETAGVTF